MEASNDEKLKKEILDIYTPLSVAKKEIWRRWNDKELRKKVDDFLGDNLPDFLSNEPKACCVRSIISPDFEFKYLLNIVKDSGLKLACVEYTKDKFTSKNEDKYHFGRLFFFHGNGKKGGNKIISKKIINFNTSEGKHLCDLKTLWGQNFVEFHHVLLEKADLGARIELFDISDWLSHINKNSSQFYLYYLSLFICHGVLFENYLTCGNEEDFTANVVLPCIKKLEKEFGFKPLIVPINPIDDEGDIYWYCYPGNLEGEVKL